MATLWINYCPKITRSIKHVCSQGYLHVSAVELESKLRMQEFERGVGTPLTEKIRYVVFDMFPKGRGKNVFFLEIFPK